MSFEAKIKITAESGASINYAGPLDEAQKDSIVGILNGETDIATLEQEARQMRARMERLECENTQLTGLVESLRAELRQENCLSFQNQVVELEAQRDELLSVFQLVIKEMEHRDRNNGNAPGHAHKIPGVWDIDNGALAGKSCAWCATWAKAKELATKAKEGTSC